MKNPLIKRLPREFTGEIAKYIVIFIFMTAVIGLISGFLIADGSVLDTYNKSFDKYNVEDGNFELYSKADDKLIDRLEEENVTIYENFYKEETLKVHNNEKLREDDQSTIRFYINRDDIDKVDVMEGRLAEDINEIALDRMYSVNNNIPNVTLEEGEHQNRTIQVKDSKLSALPSTGGIGTTIFTIAGCVIMIAAAGLFFASRKKSDNK